MNLKQNLKSKMRDMMKVFACVCCLSLFSLISLSAAAQQPVKGTVKDASGEPLIGVTVQLKGTSTGVVTDIDGKYSINAASSDVLVFSCISYEKQEVKVGTRGIINVVLESDDILLEEVVVVGYGTQRKVDITGSVASVGEDAAKDRVVMDLGQMVAGKVAGVVVSQGNAAPGSESSINIRGNTSLSSGSSPLYVIDGVISSAADVVPSEVAKIDILKDAASTAIYGSEGANGVILVTTKKGAKDYSKVDLYAMVGFQNIAKTMPLLNAQEFAFKNYMSKLVPMDPDEFVNPIGPDQPINQTNGNSVYVDDEGNYYQMRYQDNYSTYVYGSRPYPANTDWQKELYDTALIQDYRVSARGGVKGTTYSVMFGHKNQQGILYGSSYKEYSVRGNFTQKIGKRFNLIFNASYLSSQTDNSSIRNQAIFSSPMRPVDAGKGYQEQTWPESAPDPFSMNPKDIEDETTNLRFNKNFMMNGVLAVNIAKGLDLRLSASLSERMMETQFFASDNIQNFLNINGQQYNSFVNHSIAHNTNSNVTTLRSENTLNYHNKIRQHYFSFLLGYSVFSNKRINRSAGATDFALTNLGIWGMQDGLQAIKPTYIGIDNNGMSVFLRGEYNLMDRYLFKATVRADAASIFAQNNKWGFFPSAAIGWRINQENWLKDQKWLNNLKLRASYGVSGKQAIAPYQSLASAQFDSVTMDGKNFMSYLYFNKLGNSNLKWESTGEWNVGLDMGVFQDRIAFSIDAYMRTTTNLLFTDPLPGYSGFPSQTRNIGSLQNKGLEFSLQLVPYRDDNWEWNMNFNISANRAKVLALGVKPDKFITMGGDFIDSCYMEEGEALGNIYGYETEGIWKSSAELEAAKAAGLPYVYKDVRPGFTKFVDQDGDNALTTSDKKVIGNAFPDFTGGLTNNLSYKGLALSFTLTFSHGNDILNATRFNLEGIHDSRAQGGATMKDMWLPNLYYYDQLTGQKGKLFMKGNPDGTVPSNCSDRTTHFNNRVPYTDYLEDGSFLRMSDLTLSYSFPSKWMDKIKVSDLRLFATATNLFVISKYSGYDPEVNCSQGEASFLCPGLDFFPYPKARTFSFGVNLTF